MESHIIFNFFLFQTKRKPKSKRYGHQQLKSCKGILYIVTNSDDIAS